jgi:hypothetical protein
MHSDEKFIFRPDFRDPFLLLVYLVSSVTSSIFSKFWIVGLISGPLMHFWYGVARVLPNSHKYIDGVSRVGSDDYLYSGISFSIWVIGYFLVRLIVGGRIKKGGGRYLAIIVWFGVGFCNVFIIAISSV